MLEGGTSVVRSSGEASRVSTALCVGVGKAVVDWLGGRVVRCWVLRGRLLHVTDVVRGWGWLMSCVCGPASSVIKRFLGGGWGVGWCVENCIVDASIFVVKFLRAQGGCLGTRNR